MDHTVIAKDSLLTQAEAVGKLAGRVGPTFQQAVEMILACRGRTVVSGVGKSGLVGQKLAATFASTGTPSFFLNPVDAIHGDLGMLMNGDLLVFISYSGETEELLRLIPSIKNFGNRIIALSGNPRSTLAKEAEVFLDISVEREVCPNNLAPTTSTLATMAMGDALAVALIKSRNFQPLDFARFHPGGSLGRRLLTRVRDVMHPNLPVVSPRTTFHDCLLVMTSGRMGLALVMEGDKLQGLVTDGDLRRALLKGPEATTRTVADFMKPSPRTIPANTPLAKAEAFMMAEKIRALVVTDEADGKVCGVVEIFD